MEAYDPSWADTEDAKATYIDPNAKVDIELDTATIPEYGRREKSIQPPGDKGRGSDKFWDQ
tara:strand:+ start:81 stop:263 length:183 start_codon:yes stop_codon:yes gene_type:complete